jgi:succinate dehydrogenase/fumarate reductase-like Fe-S protein
MCRLPQGHCGICDVLVDGKRTVACVAKCPKKDVTIEYAKLPMRKKASQGNSPKQTKARGPAGGATVEEEEGETPAQLEDRLEAQLRREAEELQAEKGSPFGWPFK